jgi:catalase
MMGSMVQVLKRRTPQGGVKQRRAHAKTLGVVHGTFTVDALTDAGLRQGLFASPAAHECVVRLSSAGEFPQPDSVPDVRGFAIKLPDVQQDFVLVNIQTMPLGTVKLFHDAVLATESSPVLFALKMAFTGHARALWQLFNSRSTPNSPLDEHYWSTTPYMFGSSRVCKYSLVPTSAHKSPHPATLDESYLTNALQAHLEQDEASFDFMVQFGREGMSVEDAAELWPQEGAPWHKVASLRFPKQRVEMEEQLEFSPAHALPEHAPLGGLNVCRMALYKAMAEFRRG